MPRLAWRTLAAGLALGVAGCATAGRGPADGDDGPGSPVAVTRAFYQALHDGDAPRAAALVASPHAAQATAAFVRLAGAYQAVEGALQARFGPGTGGVGYASRVADERRALAAAQAQVAGDRATVTGGGRGLAALRRVGGAWKVTLEEAIASEEGLAALEAEAEAGHRAAARVAPAIRGGLFDTPDDALQAFQNELSAAAGTGEEPDLPPPDEPGLGGPAGPEGPGPAPVKL